MAERFRVRLEKADMVFSAAHFITFNGNICERLHGHNYRVFAEVVGGLDENQYVVDFIALRDAMRGLVETLDHHVLLPTHHPMIRVVSRDGEIEAKFESGSETRRWVFPKGDCVLLPVENTTAELLAKYLGHRLQSDLEARTGQRFALVVGVDENGGQWGIWESD